MAETTKLPRITSDWGWKKIRDWEPDQEVNPAQWAHIAAYTYMALKTQHCSDGWTPADIQSLARMMRNMGHPLHKDICKGIPKDSDSVTIDRVKRWFVKIRKAGFVPSVLNRNMRRLGKKEINATAVN